MTTEPLELIPTLSPALTPQAETPLPGTLPSAEPKNGIVGASQAPDRIDQAIFEAGLTAKPESAVYRRYRKAFKNYQMDLQKWYTDLIPEVMAIYIAEKEGVDDESMHKMP
jgi:hypothetical protein